MFIVFIAIAVAILVYFAFSGGAVAAEPRLEDKKIETSAVAATVKDKYIDENGQKRSHFLTHMVAFDCEDGVAREFDVPHEIYNAVAIGERETLVYSNANFLGFGEHGSVESEEVQTVDDEGFTLDDYDESIDVELDPVIQEQDNGLDDENKEYFEIFLEREKLPVKTETVEYETDSLSDYSALKLLEKTAIYPFLKRENAVRRIFLRTYDEAMQDLLCFEGDYRKGMAADSEFVNKNEIRVAITLQENPAPLVNRITAEFGVNE